ncbi:hypothetical protein OAF83_00705 [Rubripirellula sp.]|nr:hypothetical protein [Rubripirellula sp.]
MSGDVVVVFQILHQQGPIKMSMIKDTLFVAVFSGVLLAGSFGLAAPPGNQSIYNSILRQEVSQYRNKYTVNYDVYFAVPAYGWQVLWVLDTGETVEGYTFGTYERAEYFSTRALVGGRAPEGVQERIICRVELEPRFMFLMRVETSEEARELVEILRDMGHYTDVRRVWLWSGASR